MKTAACRRQSICRNRRKLLFLVFLSFGSLWLKAANPISVVRDDNLTLIDTVEVFRNGLYWWTGATCSGEFGHVGGASYRPYTNVRYSPAALSREVTRIPVSGTSEAGVFTGDFPSRDINVLPSSCGYGNYFVRDDEAFYYVLNGSLYRKPLTLGPSASGETINQAVGLSRLPIAAHGVLAVDGSQLWYYFRNNNGTINVSTSGKSGIVLPRPQFSVNSVGVKKFLIVDVKNTDGSRLRTSALLLTFEGQLFEVNLAGRTPVLLRSGLNDFAVRDESVRQTSGISITVRHYTAVYAALGNRVTYSGNGALLALDITGGGSTEAFTTRSRDLQITSVAADNDRIFITRTPSASEARSDLLRLESPAHAGLIIRPGTFETITLVQREFRSLRSDGQWVYFAHGNTIQKITTDAPAVALDYAALGLEVTQGIQNLNNSVPLVARKPVIVRGYARLAANTTGRASFHVPAELRVARGGIEIPGSPFLPDDWAAVQAVTSLASVRTNGAASYQFYVPPEYLNPGDTEFRFVINPGRVAPETGAAPLANNTATAVVPLINVARPTLVFAVMSSTLPNYDPKAPNSGFWQILSRAESMLPVPGFDVRLRSGSITKPVVTLFGIKARSFAMPDDASLALAWLAFANATDNLTDFFSPPYYVGMFPPGVEKFGGLGGLAGQRLSDISAGLKQLLEVVGVPDLSLPDNPFTRSSIMRMAMDSGGAAFNVPFGGTTLAHELGHNLGRRHIHSTLACGTEEPEGPYHDLPNGASPCTLGATDLNDPATSMGFDPLTWAIIQPSMTGDLLSYANARWTSEFTWRAILEKLPKGPAAFAPASLASPRPHNAPAAGPVLLVQGFLNKELNGGGLFPAYTLPSDLLAGHNLEQLTRLSAGFPENYPLRLRLLDAAGQQLADEAVVFPPISDETETFPFIQALPAVAGANRLQLVNGTSLLAEVSISANAPVLSLHFPVLDPPTSSLRLSWTATDADGDALHFTVQYSPDDGRTWETVAVNHPETELILSTSLLPGGAAARVRVLASDGIHTTIATSESFLVPKHAPTVHITGILEGQPLELNATLTVRGHAYDAEDGRLNGAALRWSLTGPEERNGTGEYFLLSNLAPGAYTLKLAAVDSDGQTGEAEVHFSVRPLAVADSEEPVLDGLSADPGYSKTPSLRVATSDGIFATAYFTHANGALFICFTGMRYGAPGSPGASVGLRLDTTLAGTFGSNAIGFAVDEHGMPYRSAGNGTQLVAMGSPPEGFTVVILRDEKSWNAELRITDELLGGWNRNVGLVLLTDDGVVATPPPIWPPKADLSQPGTWVASQASAPTPIPDQAPIANAGPAQSRALVSGEIVILDGGGSFDPEGAPLTYQWTQTGGPSLSLSGADTATASFSVPKLDVPTTFSFRLVVNDSRLDSAPALTEATITPLDAGCPPASEPQWVLRSASGPSARSGHSLAYDSKRNVTVLFGGGFRTNNADAGVTYNDLWEWNGADWHLRMPSSATEGWTNLPPIGWRPSYTGRPVSRRQHDMVYDSRRGKIILFGGQTRTPDRLQLFLNDVWEWDGNQWSFQGTNGPSGRINHAMAYDQARGVTVVYGGFLSQFDPQASAVWEWNGVDWTMTATTNGPSKSYSQDIGGMIYDPSRQVALFGPSVGDGFWNFWSWDGQNWAPEPGSDPIQLQRLQYGALAHEPYRDGTVFFGGRNGPASNVAAFYDGSQWLLQTNSPVLPEPRFEHALAHDLERRATVLFGGETLDASNNVSYHGDTWELTRIDRPYLTEHPADSIVEMGGVAHLSATAAGSAPLRYQWLRGGVELVDNDRISGAASPILTVRNLSAADAGQYRLRVSNNCGITTSATVSLAFSAGALELEIARAGTSTSLTWTTPGAALQRAESIEGPWTDIPAATSPYVLDPGGRHQFFRLTLRN